jgi:hypothetical protein
MMHWNKSALKTLCRLANKHEVTVRSTEDGRFFVRRLQRYADREKVRPWLTLYMSIGRARNRFEDQVAGGWVEEFQIDPEWLTGDRLPTVSALAGKMVEE